ncbi:MAG: hypothetical protein J6Y68_02300 [Clostridia bacterium]|nr:hypothetical protein [Clostridia bacterium]MBP5593045.1 hypothetical protein [Clostridia bacterium]MBP5648935.1 hypothetical protein [Clostridia bacterium]
MLSKDLKNAPKGAITKFVSSIVGMVISFLLILSGGFAFAWFSQSGSVSPSGVQLAVTSDTFDIYVNRTSEYDRSVYAGVPLMKSLLGTNGYSSVISKTDASNFGIAVELVNDFVNLGEDGLIDTEDDTRYLRPGAFGTFSFYLVPKQGSSVTTYSVSLNTVGYDAILTVNENSQQVVISGVEEYSGDDASQIQDLLKGHFLFFKSRSGNNANDYQYSDLIEGRDFVIDTAQLEPTNISINGQSTTCYEITLYWVWPLTYETMLTQAYPASMQQYILENRSYFFATNLDSSDDMKLSDGYNDADQRIGDKIDYLAVFLRISANSSAS